MSVFCTVLACASLSHAYTIPLAFDAAFDPGEATLLGLSRLRYGLDRSSVVHVAAASAPASRCSVKHRSLGGFSVDLNVSLTQPSDWGAPVLRAQNTQADTEWSADIGIGGFSSQTFVPCTDAILYDSSCASCELNNHTAFDASRSYTFSNVTGRPFGPFSYADGSTVQGTTGNDTISLSSTSHAKKQLLGLVTARSGFSASSKYDGIIGLSRPLQSSLVEQGTPSLFGTLCQQRAIPQPIIGIALVKATQPGNIGGGGEYSFGSINRKYVAGPITYVDVASTNAWGVNLTDVTARGESLFATADRRRAVIDTGTTLILTSDAVAQRLHSLVPGSTFDAGMHAWTVPCATSTLNGAPNVFFDIGGSTFGVPAADLAFQSGFKTGTCLSLVQGGSNEYTVLGDGFIKNHYIVLDYVSFHIETVTPRVGFANRTDVAPIL